MVGGHTSESWVHAPASRVPRAARAPARSSETGLGEPRRDGIAAGQNRTDGKPPRVVASQRVPRSVPRESATTPPAGVAHPCL
jgi:hypothetical protein